MDESSLLSQLFLTLPSVSGLHAPCTDLHALLRTVARSEIEKRFSSEDNSEQEFGPFGRLIFPYFKMGAIDSMNLFDLDELIMFSFYWANRGRYRATLDIGANIGLHSVLMAKCGYEVRSFEPDPTHFAALLRNLSLNGSARVAPENAAVSAAAGEMEFVRVLGNTTGSHLVGSKPGAYGELERFPVRTMAFAPLLEGCDLVKLDVEGHECGVLASTTHRDWIGTDGLISVHDERNAVAVYEHCRDIQVNMFSQKSGWSQIGSINEMPASHHEGSLFLSLSEAMPWT